MGYRTDSADGQWREFRNSISLLLLGAVASTLGRFLFVSITNRMRLKPGKAFGVPAGSFYRLIVGFVVVYVLHRQQSVIIAFILVSSYLLGRLTRGTRARIPLTWVFGIAVLLLKESYRLRYLKHFEVNEVRSGIFSNLSSI